MHLYLHYLNLPQNSQSGMVCFYLRRWITSHSGKPALAIHSIQSIHIITAQPAGRDLSQHVGNELVTACILLEIFELRTHRAGNSGLHVAFIGCGDIVNTDKWNM